MPLLPAYRRPARTRPISLALAEVGPGDLASAGSTAGDVVMTMTTPVTAYVTAVLVAHDGARWLPRTLAAIAALSRPPDHLVAVDTASLDTSRDLLRAALGPAAVLVLPRRTGFGTAVARGLLHAHARCSRASAAGARPTPGAVPVVEWVWLLHDDVEPAPDSLARLLETASGDPTIGIVGPKHHGWSDERRLLEVGVTIARGGRRETGLDERELDQGQHDGVHDVMAVSTAGMLVRREVWDSLGGLDPLLAFSRDDVDLGWRARLAGHRVVCQTGAVVRHAEAAAHGRRPATARAGHARRLDRRNSLHVLLVNLPLTSLPAALVRLGLCSLLRALLLIVRGRGGGALDELLAALAVLGRPDRVVAGRAMRRRTRTVGARSVTPWLASRQSGVGHTLDTLADLFGGMQSRVTSEMRDRDAVDAVTDLRASDRVMDLRDRANPVRTSPSGSPLTQSVSPSPSAPTGVRRPAPRTLLARSLLRPGALTIGALSVLALLAGRDLLGPGRLAGGALLPAPDGAYGLWRSALASWHPVGLGSAAMAPPDLAALAALSLPLLGSVDRLVDLLLIGGVPLCGAAAWLLLRQVTDNRWRSAWGAATYALLPAVTGAIAAGRLGAVVLAICVPLIALGATRALTRGWRRTSALSAAFGTGAALALATAFEPVSYPIAVLVAGVVAVLAVRGWGLARLAVVLAVPPAVLLPMTVAVVAEPGLLLRARGMPVAAGNAAGADTPGLDQVALLLLDPGGPGARPWWWVGAGVVTLATLAWVRGGRCPGVRIAGGVAVTSLAVAQILPHLQADPRLGAGPVWPGPALLVAGLALVSCAVMGPADLREVCSATRIGSRRLLIALVALAAMSSPLLAAIQWSTHGTGELLSRVETDLLPAYVVHDARSGARTRTVVIAGDGSAGGALRVTLLRDRGPRLGDADLVASGSAPAEMAAAVGLLASGSGGVGSGGAGSGGVGSLGVGRDLGGDDPGTAALAQLRGFGVGYLLLARPVDPGLASAIDAEPGLARVSSPDGDALWRLDQPGVRARILAADGTDLSSVDAGEVGLDTALEAGPRGRRLLLAETADPGWRATIDGLPLRPSTQGWAQAFALPPSGGRLVVRHVDEDRDVLVIGQGALAVLVLLAALPGTRRDPQRTGAGAL
jgi:GT2 family glycosyltransferase